MQNLTNKPTFWLCQKLASGHKGTDCFSTVKLDDFKKGYK